MKAKFFKAKSVLILTKNIQDNLELYRTGDFDFIANDPEGVFDSSLDIDEEKLSRISCTLDDHNEVANAMLMFESVNGLSHYLARDDRLWTYLSHTILLKYARERWPIPEGDEMAVKHIKNHFFCIGARGIERDNASSRLWWMASLCNRVGGLSLEQSLISLFHRQDVRSNIIDRPTTSQNLKTFSIVLKRLHESYHSDEKLFERKRFRAFMRWLNLAGGVKLLATLSEEQVMSVVDDCILRASS